MNETQWIEPSCGGARHVTRYVLLSVVLLLAVFLRMHNIPREMLFYDEIVSFTHLDEPGLLSYLKAFRADDPAGPPAYFVLQYLWSRVFGTGELAMRMLSVTLGVAGVFALYLFGKRWFSHAVGLLAALFMSMTPVMIFYSQQIRMYALVVFLVVLSVHAFLLFIETGKRKWFLIATITNTAVILAHPIAAIVCASEAAVLLIFPQHRKEFLRWTLCQVLAAVPYLFWLGTTDMAHLHQVLPARGRSPGFSFRVGIWGWLRSGAGWIWLSPRGTVVGHVHHRLLESGWPLVCCYAACIGTLINRIARKSIRITPGIALVLLWALLPVVWVALLSLTVSPAYIPRYLVFGVPPFYVLGAAGLGAQKRKWRHAILGALLLLYCHQLAIISSKPMLTDWNKIARTIQEEGGREDLVVVTGYPHYRSLIYWVRRNGDSRDILLMPDVPWIITSRTARLLKQSQSAENVWVITDWQFWHEQPWPLPRSLRPIAEVRKFEGNAAARLIRVSSRDWLRYAVAR